MVLRLFVLKHLQGWSYATLEREVRANLIYRDFTRIGGEPVPDAKTMVRLGQALGPELIYQLHTRLVQVARAEKVVTGRKMRLDTTVVETNIHYPTDSSLLTDGARVLTRTMQQIQAEVGALGTAVRNRLRSVTHRLLEIGKASRSRGAAALARQQVGYQKLMALTQRILGQATRVASEVRQGIKRARTALGQVVIEGLAQHLDEVQALTRRVLTQTKARILEGNTHFPRNC